MKKLAVIGCGIAAKPIIEQANEMGVKVYCFGLEIHKDCSNLIFEFIKCDIKDVEKICKECSRKNIDGVIATSETTTEITAIIAEKMNYVGNKRVKGEFTFKNKYLMRKALENSKIISQPKFNYYKELTKIKYPIVVKALDACGKKGISYVDDESKLNSALQYALDSTTKEDILIEEYIEGGQEYSIEAISYKGKNYIIQITEKESSGPPHFVELGHHQPAQLDNKSKNIIKTAIDEILNKIGIINGLSHTEIIMKDDKVFFIESGARAGGDFIGDVLIKLSTNYDYYKNAIDVALGQFKYSKFKNKNHCGVYFLCKQTNYLKPLFSMAKDSKWLYELKNIDKITEKKANDDGGSSGYLIYSSDHKITLRDYPFKAECINKRKSALDMLIDFNKNIGRHISDTELKVGMKKFIEKGNVITIIYDNQIIAMANLYCNNYETKEAYLNNVEVMKEYRGYGLSKLLIEKAFSIVKENNFNIIKLDVEEDNYVAVRLYEKYGFKFTDNYKQIGELTTREMIFRIGD